MSYRIIYFFIAIIAIIASNNHVQAQVNVTNDVVLSNVTLVWEAQTYVPPFYKGRALFADGADVKILAFPPTDLGDPSQLNYKWKVDGTVIQEASGTGRRFFIYESGMFGGSPLIVVEVSNGTATAGTGVIRVPLTKPRVALYQSLPLAGILFGTSIDKAVDQEASIEAYPLFFSVETRSDPSLTYQWKVDDISSQNPLGNKGSLFVRNENGGRTTLQLQIFNTANLLENAKNALTVQFE
jgi:hypothetical protein